MKIEKITRALCKTLRDELNAALVPLAKELGVTIHCGNASYSDNAVKFKLEVAVEGYDPEKEEYEQMCLLYRLKADQRGEAFNYNGHHYTLAGISAKARKFPIIATRDDGKKYKLPEHAIKSLQKAEAAL
jgi:hypothetical protein